MLILLLTAVAPTLPALDSPDYAKVLRRDRAEVSETVKSSVANRLAGVAWQLCGKGDQAVEVWSRRNHLTQAENEILTGHCVTYYFGRRSLGRKH